MQSHKPVGKGSTLWCTSKDHLHLTYSSAIDAKMSRIMCLAMIAGTMAYSPLLVTPLCGTRARLAHSMPRVSRCEGTCLKMAGVEGGDANRREEMPRARFLERLRTGAMTMAAVGVCPVQAFEDTPGKVHVFVQCKFYNE